MARITENLGAHVLQVVRVSVVASFSTPGWSWGGCAGGVEVFRVSLVCASPGRQFGNSAGKGRRLCPVGADNRIIDARCPRRGL